MLILNQKRQYKSLILNTALILSFYYLIKYLTKHDYKLKFSAFFSNFLIKYENKKFKEIKKNLIYKQLLKCENKSVFEIGCGCGTNLSYYPPGE